ncbi:hypothetical protein [Clostridium sp.]|uniref:hypothetical protein n=1 Tax=Clostridium sp. TaxID=1506 RepID=UPI0025BF1EAC|nr:hypothetical protein [Clostridium sp.]
MTYRCRCKDNQKMCKNKEVRREYIEEFVVEQLLNNILCNSAIKVLTEELKKQNSSLNNNLTRNFINIIKKTISDYVDKVVVFTFGGGEPYTIVATISRDDLLENFR